MVIRIFKIRITMAIRIVNPKIDTADDGRDRIVVLYAYFEILDIYKFHDKT